MKIIDIASMTIRDIDNEIKRLENQRDYYVDKKQKAVDKTQPQAVNYDKVNVNGGKREDKFISYLIECEDYDCFIDNIQDEIFRLTRFVDKELKRIGEYDPLMQDIIKAKEQLSLTWENVSLSVGYSVSQCRRIYKKYKNQRDI